MQASQSNFIRVVVICILGIFATISYVFNGLKVFSGGICVLLQLLLYEVYRERRISSKLLALFKQLKSLYQLRRPTRGSISRIFFSLSQLGLLRGRVWLGTLPCPW